RAFTTGTAVNASTTALTKKLMKPRPTWCFFWNSSLYFVRSSMTADRSASLNVVSVAVVCCDSSRRSAIRWRMVDIFCRVSRAGWTGGGAARARGGRGLREKGGGGGGGAG